MADWGAIAGFAGVAVGAFALWKSREANTISTRANEIAEESKRVSEQANKHSETANSIANHANYLADEANTLAKEYNERSIEIATEARNREIERDRYERSADIQPLGNPAASGHQDIGRINFTLTNLGRSIAREVTVILRPVGETQLVTASPIANIEPDHKETFGFEVAYMSYNPDAQSRIVDFIVTYKDQTGKHKKEFRHNWNGHFKARTGWRFTWLDVRFDGKRISFLEAPGLAGGIAFEDEL